MEHIFDNYFLIFLWQLFIESRNFPQKHPIPPLFFKKSTRQILQRVYSEEVLVPNLIEINFIEILEILSFYTAVLL